MKRGRKLGEISSKILRMIWEEGKMAIYEWQRAGEELNIVYNRRKFYQYMYNLERHGFVKKTFLEKKNRSFFHLTPKGKLQILKYLHLEKIRKKKWDGRWRVIIFDIPETLRKWRGYIRNELKGLGFMPLQESVYLTPFPVTEELERFLKKWNLRKYFRYLTVTELDNDLEFKDFFGLK